MPKEKFLPRKSNGNIDWKLFIVGDDWKKFLMSTLLFIAILLMTYGYWQEHKVLVDIERNPCDWIVRINKACTATQTTTSPLQAYNENTTLIPSNSTGTP